MRGSKLRGGLLAAALSLSVALSGCTGGNTVSARDGAIYVEGLLSASYLGQAEEDYLRMMDYTDKELRQVWDTSMETEAAFFFRYFGLESVPEASITAAAELYRGIYEKASFSVISAAKQTDGSISVKVELAPLNTIRLLLDQEKETLEHLKEIYPETAWLGEADRAIYAQALVEALGRVAPQTATLSTETHLVELTADSDGNYTLPQRYFQLLDGRMIEYP